VNVRVDHPRHQQHVAGLDHPIGGLRLDPRSYMGDAVVLDQHIRGFGPNAGAVAHRQQNAVLEEGPHR
jgi:hypothetical protein